MIVLTEKEYYDRCLKYFDLGKNDSWVSHAKLEIKGEIKKSRKTRGVKCL